MEVVFNKDSSYFNITSDDLKGDDSVTKIISDDVISLTINEELGKMTSGTLAMIDNTFVYSKMFRTGMIIKIEWGYKKFFQNINVSSTDSEEQDSPGSRQNLTGILQVPDGSCSQQGEHTYTITFIADEFLSVKEKKVYDSGTKKKMVEDSFDALGIDDFIIDFEGQDDNITKSNSIRQNEGTYKFLLRQSRRLGAIFMINNKNTGGKVGLFIDETKLGTDKVKDFLKKTTGAQGSRKTLRWNEPKDSNVISYSWKHNVGESGQGDGVNISYVNGSPVITRYVIEDQKVKAWKLNTNKIKRRLAQEEGLGSKTTLTRNLLGAKDFEQVKWAFDPVEVETAPQGVGYSIDAQMHGDPSVTIPLEVRFEGNFPPPLLQAQAVDAVISFVLYKVTHTLSKDGYKMAVTVADAHTTTGTFIQEEERF
jgi:hypothetical protein